MSAPTSSAFDPPRPAVADVVRRALAEDLGPLGDITAALVPPSARVVASMVARDSGVLAGRACVTETFRQVEPAIEVDWVRADGDRVARGDATSRSWPDPSPSVLTAERTALNFLCHLSGVATATRRLVDAVTAANPRTQVWDTRKTSPGLRAAGEGGGAGRRGRQPPRLALGHGAGEGQPPGRALDHRGRRPLARRRWPGRTVEVECDRLEQVREAVEAGATIVMCDNMTPEEVAAAVALVAGRALVEVSGGITLATAPAYAAAGADLLSTSTITQSAPAFDIGLDLSH